MPLSKVDNKYSYEVENEISDESTIIDFVPSKTTEKVELKVEEVDNVEEDDEKYEEEDEEMSNEIPILVNAKKNKGKNKDKKKAKELLSAVKLKNKKKRNKSFRSSGYLASSGPTDFLKKKYHSPLLKVC